MSIKGKIVKVSSSLSDSEMPAGDRKGCHRSSDSQHQTLIDDDRTADVRRCMQRRFVKWMPLACSLAAVVLSAWVTAFCIYRVRQLEENYRQLQIMCDHDDSYVQRLIDEKLKAQLQQVL